MQNQWPEWSTTLSTVIPQGTRNALATQQQQITIALCEYIGKICHVYPDNIVIWSQSLEEHECNVCLVLEALRAAHLDFSSPITLLFCLEIDFRGHHISRNGIAADKSKAKWIACWPCPRSIKDVCSFLGLIHDLAAFLPHLANHTAILTPFTTKEAKLVFPPWTDITQLAFEAIKLLVISRECLTVIDHSNLGKIWIFVITNASDWRTGAVLSFGPTWETACPVAYNSQTLSGKTSHYATHEKELLAIICGIPICLDTISPCAPTIKCLKFSKHSLTFPIGNPAGWI